MCFRTKNTRESKRKLRWPHTVPSECGHLGFWTFGSSLRASSPIWASKTSLARTRERAAKPREARFACPNRRACSQASSDRARLCGSRKYPYPPTEGIGFSRGEGGSICLIFQWGGGINIGKYFQRVLVTRKRVTKKKHKNLPRQFICEDIKHDES